MSNIVHLHFTIYISRSAPKVSVSGWADECNPTNSPQNGASSYFVLHHYYLDLFLHWIILCTLKNKSLGVQGPGFMIVILWWHISFECSGWLFCRTNLIFWALMISSCLGWDDRRRGCWIHTDADPESEVPKLPSVPKASFSVFVRPECSGQVLGPETFTCCSSKESVVTIRVNFCFSVMILSHFLLHKVIEFGFHPFYNNSYKSKLFFVSGCY